MGSGYGSGTGDGLGGLGGSSGIGIGERSVSFLGVQSSGERVAILVDCSDYMLEDGKGGMWAFRVVKDECVKLVSAMQPGVLFNVYLFSHNNVNRFRPHMVATTPTVIQDLSEWVAPINEDAAKRGAQDNNFTPEREFFHQRATMYWNGRKRDKPQGVHTWANYGRALHAAMEDQAEAIFMIIATNPPMTEVFEDMNERTKKELLIIQARQDKRYETDIKIWEREYERWKELQEKAYRDYQAELAKARRELHDPVYAKAKEILDAENARRKAAGRPPRIIVGDAIKTIMEENNLKLPPLNVRRPAAVKNPPNRPQPGHVLVRPYTLMRMIEKFKQEIVPELYRLHPKKVIPSVNIILFGEGEAAEKYWTDFVEGVNQRNRGQFRKITSLEEMEASARLSIEQRGKYQGR